MGLGRAGYGVAAARPGTAVAGANGRNRYRIRKAPSPSGGSGWTAEDTPRAGCQPRPGRWPGGGRGQAPVSSGFAGAAAAPAGADRSADLRGHPPVRCGGRGHYAAARQLPAEALVGSTVDESGGRRPLPGDRDPRLHLSGRSAGPRLRVLLVSRVSGAHRHHRLAARHHRDRRGHRGDGRRRAGGARWPRPCWPRWDSWVTWPTWPWRRTGWTDGSGSRSTPAT